MPFELFLALRYLRVRRGRRGAAQLTALAATAGIACGVAALIVALALANGFRDELQDKILRGTAHITITRSDGEPLRDRTALVAEIRRMEGVVDAHATSYTGALLSGHEGAAYTVLRGLDAESERAVAEVRRTMIEGDTERLFEEKATNLPSSLKAADVPSDVEANGGVTHGVDRSKASTEDSREDEEPPAPIIVGAELAKRTGLARVGDEGWIVVGEKSPMPPGFTPRARRVRVAGVFRSGLYDYDATWTYLPLALAESLSDERAGGSVVSVEVADIYATNRVAEALRQKLGERFTIVDWRDANRQLFTALELERRTVAIIIALIIIVAALNITATVVLVVVERRADIAVLGALGAGSRSVMLIFIIEGALIGAAGALAGVALGLAACFLGNHFGLVRLPPDVYSLSVVPLHPHAREVLYAALAAFLVSLLATLYPARTAARVRPAKALRYE
jgi:lipoprotein-releasing system permease protein